MYKRVQKKDLKLNIDKVLIPNKNNEEVLYPELLNHCNIYISGGNMKKNRFGDLKEITKETKDAFNHGENIGFQQNGYVFLFGNEDHFGFILKDKRYKDLLNSNKLNVSIID